jgi:hypothetical protein
MPLLIPVTNSSMPPVGIYYGMEAITAGAYLKALERGIDRSSFWRAKRAFQDARTRLKTLTDLSAGWDTYDAEPPAPLACTLAVDVLDCLEAAALPPDRIKPSVEGGIAMSFVNGENRAEIEIYNSGEIALASYSNQTEPIIQEWNSAESDMSALKKGVAEIRVRLAS